MAVGGAREGPPLGVKTSPNEGEIFARKSMNDMALTGDISDIRGTKGRSCLGWLECPLHGFAAHASAGVQTSVASASRLTATQITSPSFRGVLIFLMTDCNLKSSLKIRGFTEVT